MKFIEVTTTFETNDEAINTANHILDDGLGACCSVQEINSIFIWKNKVETAIVWQLTIKTKESLYAEVEGHILKNHPYETPQIVAVPILYGSKDYLKWIENETK